MKDRRFLNEADDKNKGPKKRLKDMKPMRVAISKRAGVSAEVLKRRHEEAMETDGLKKVPVDKILNTSIEQGDKGPGNYLLTITFKDGFDPMENVEQAKLAISSYLNAYIGGSTNNQKEANLFKKEDSTDNTWYLQYTVESKDMAGTLVRDIENGKDPRTILERMVSDKILEKMRRNGK